ncbi:MAG: YgeY family selenium metabolism-linked hydrolase [Candidatus Cloacimonetes bacterium]|jgi:putative selenium metabolism hydrolase|nr:YgeY family selenium metabolism-linked hydrolase [Candidatus Cloacimonadota bacterium]MCB5286618.1 YgeY family selenium metabolism-linked hydrolase [Candidatus Cloacimonadota bacterium]MCK9185010.1 YgeY family selenium metabolism-linked hydrolase [Candidatus Cloacimonadota bacterium]MCK9583559.1 YgeY family selenium metabolism-linked hydrolase [Candidatus Cloacimonadota bacterium]MDY0228938.1 YgeY family selenium metabolism-linked hydrolase [Candidatus Cloacimonadaceae bacterium]
MYKEIYAKAKAYEAETVRFLMDMVKIPSFSTTEKEVVLAIKKEMEAAGFDEVFIDPLGNVIGRIGNGPKVIAFDAHVDTVYPGERSLWDFDPFDAHVKDGKVWGRGTVDQEGGMASMVTAGRIIKDLGLQEGFTLYFTGTVMEEDCDGLCWQYIIAEDKILPELVVITEPTNMNIYRGHRGRMEMMVHVKGLSCHGSAPERGDNAIYKISRIALEIEKLHTRLHEDEFLGKGSIAVTEVYFTGPSQCAVPDSARIHLDRRLTWGETETSAVAEVAEACRLAGQPDAEIEVLSYAEAAYTGLVYPTKKYYPTWVTPADSPWIKAAEASYTQTLGRAPKVDKWTFSTNGVAIAGMHGIPCIGLGPGNEIYAHAPNEATPIKDLTEAAAFYAALIFELKP